MCTIIDSGRHPNNEPLTAKEDIVCYKFLYKNLLHGGTSPLQSHCFWEEGKIKEEQMGEPELYAIRTYQITKGFHALISKDMAFKFNRVVYESDTSNTSLTTSGGEIPTIREYTKKVNAKMVIPKGAKYFIGLNDDVVANKMKFVEFIDNE